MITTTPLFLLSLTLLHCTQSSESASNGGTTTGTPAPPLTRPQIGEIRGYDFSAGKKSVQIVELPKKLSEASGLAFTHDGRLLAHNDESAIIFEIDYRTGSEVKRFYVGRPRLTGDFEGIAVKQDTVFLVSSNGVLYRFSEGKKDAYVSYDFFRTSLSARQDVEGLAYDPDTDCLLLACKGDPGAGLDKNTKAVYAFSLKTYKLDPKPRFLLSVETIIASTGAKEFNPSAIERHATSGNFFVLAYNGFAIVEIDPSGKIIGISDVKKSVNKQPEGLAITADGTIIIANEGQKKRGKLAIYPPQN